MLTRSAARRQGPSTGTNSVSASPSRTKSSVTETTNAESNISSVPITSFIDSDGVRITVQPSATGQGTLMKWEYDFPQPIIAHPDAGPIIESEGRFTSRGAFSPSLFSLGSLSSISETSVSDLKVLETQSETTASSGQTQEAVEDNRRFVTPAPQESFYPTSVLHTPRKARKSCPLKPSPERIGAPSLTIFGVIKNSPTLGRIHVLVMENMTQEEKETWEMRIVNEQLARLDEHRNASEAMIHGGIAGSLSGAFVPMQSQSSQEADPSHLSRSDHRPLQLQATIPWEDSNKYNARAPPLTRAVDEGPGPRLGPNGEQLLGRNGTYLQLTASETEISSTTEPARNSTIGIVVHPPTRTPSLSTAGMTQDASTLGEDQDDVMDIEMDLSGRLKGPIGPDLERLNKDGRPMLGPCGTLLVYDWQMIYERALDERLNAFGLLPGPKLVRQDTEIIE